MSDAQDSHVLVSILKDLAIELERTPNRQQFYDRVTNAEKRITRAFGTYTALCQAAGIEPNTGANKPKKIDNTIFEKDIERHLEQYQPREIKERGPYPTIASISDIHFPFENQRVLDAFYRFIEKHKPEYVLVNGDSVDNYSHTRFPRSHNVFTPREEQSLARKKLETLWEEVKKATPNSKRLLMLGNHCARPLKQVLENYPEAEDWIVEALKKQFTFTGVETVMDPREEYMLGDIMIHHGYRSGLGAHRDYALYNAIVGHTHVGGVTYRRVRGQTLWELNSGYAGDPEAKGLTYTPQKITNWTPGFGMVHEDGPRFIPIG